jgi:hypothetical protein
MRKVAVWRCVLVAAVWAAGVAGDLLPVIPVVVACQMDMRHKGDLAAARVPKADKGAQPRRGFSIR